MLGYRGSRKLKKSCCQSRSIGCRWGKTVADGQKAWSWYSSLSRDPVISRVDGGVIERGLSRCKQVRYSKRFASGWRKRERSVDEHKTEWSRRLVDGLGGGRKVKSRCSDAGTMCCTKVISLSSDEVGCGDDVRFVVGFEWLSFGDRCAMQKGENFQTTNWKWEGGLILLNPGPSRNLSNSRRWSGRIPNLGRRYSGSQVTARQGRQEWCCSVDTFPYPTNRLLAETFSVFGYLELANCRSQFLG